MFTFQPFHSNGGTGAFIVFADTMNPYIGGMFKRIPSFLYNKYLLALVAFLVWLTFFDRNNFISQVRYGRTLNKQRQQKEFYKSEIVKDSTALVELSDSTRLEKFAREKYLFKKDNEDIYLIVEEEKQ